MSNIREFSLRVVLTVTTGRLLTKSKEERDNGIGDLYEILGHMTNDSPYTHALGRFAEECKPWLLRWYPSLSIAEERLGDLDILMEENGKEGIETWLQELENEIGSTFNLGQIPRDDHDIKDPYDELVAMRGSDKNIIVVNTSNK